MMNGYYGGMGWVGWVLMALVMVTFWGLVIYAVIALFRGSGTSTSPDNVQPADPRRILDERFARGEIQLEEYQARASVLCDAKSRPQ